MTQAVIRVEEGVLLRQVFSNLAVASPPKNVGTNLRELDWIQSRGLWDTGASKSSIDRRLATDLGLLPSGKTRSFHAQGDGGYVDTYLISLNIDDQVYIPAIPVTAGEFPDFGILIGMDIICHGDMLLTNSKGISRFSFRIPASDEILYHNGFPQAAANSAPLLASKQVGRNALCPCGSGKKYKRCCGA